MSLRKLASHVVYHENSPQAGDFRAPLRLAKGGVSPLPFDPSYAGRLSPLHPDDRKGNYPVPELTAQGVLAVLTDLLTEPFEQTSPAPSPDATAAEPTPADRQAVPWRGRKRSANPLSEVIHIRCTPAQRADYEAEAERTGLGVGEYFRTLAEKGPRLRASRRPTIEKQDLARLLGHIGKLGSNVNQLAHAANAAGFKVSADKLDVITDDIRAMRAAVMKALGYGD